MTRRWLSTRSMHRPGTTRGFVLPTWIAGRMPASATIGRWTSTRFSHRPGTAGGTASPTSGRRKEAAACYDQALALDPQDPVTWNSKGANLHGPRPPGGEALDCYDQALVFDPQYAAAWNNKGANLFELERREEAIACYDQALTLDPKYRTPGITRGFVSPP